METALKMGNVKQSLTPHVNEAKIQRYENNTTFIHSINSVQIANEVEWYLNIK